MPEVILSLLVTDIVVVWRAEDSIDVFRRQLIKYERRLLTLLPRINIPHSPFCLNGERSSSLERPEKHPGSDFGRP
jgi:hypothetical protein